MKRFAPFAALLLAVSAASAAHAAAVGGDDVKPPVLSEKPLFDENATASEMLAVCRAMVPANVEIRGHLNRRSRRGTSIAAYKYVLKRENGVVFLSVSDKDGKSVELKPEGRLLDTDITWSDLSLDYLWWTDVEFDAQREAESLQGVICRVLRLRNGEREVRIWIDRRSGAMLQAEEISGGKVSRELFCTSLKKFGDRWAPRNIEVGAPGAKYRTKIVIDDVL